MGQPSTHGSQQSAALVVPQSSDTGPGIAPPGATGMRRGAGSGVLLDSETSGLSGALLFLLGVSEEAPGLLSDFSPGLIVAAVPASRGGSTGRTCTVSGLWA